MLDCAESDVLSRLELMKADGLIREITGIFDSTALGYHQALVAMSVADEKHETAGNQIAAHPGVSHCYGRTGKYNLWFTLACSAQSKLGLKKTAEILAQNCDASAWLLLPSLKCYKLDVRFPPNSNKSSQATKELAGLQSGAGLPLTPNQLKAIKALQLDLPIKQDPFADIAAEQNLDTDMLLVHAADLAAAGVLKRYAAVINHRAAGAQANVMVIWRVEEAVADAIGKKCAQLPAISHCYLRPRSDDWPYNLYTMIHGRNRQDCAMTIDEIVTTTELGEHVELWTEKEFKKQRVKLFSNEEAEWEAKFSA